MPEIIKSRDGGGWHIANCRIVPIEDMRKANLIVERNCVGSVT